MIRYLFALALLALAIAPPAAPTYPLDGDVATGIRRLTHARLVQAGQLPGPKQPPGERLSLDQVNLRLLEQKDLDLPRPDPELTREIVGLLGRMADRYAIAVLDVSDPTAPRYAERNGLSATSVCTGRRSPSEALPSKNVFSRPNSSR